MAWKVFSAKAEGFQLGWNGLNGMFEIKTKRSECPIVLKRQNTNAFSKVVFFENDLTEQMKKQSFEQWSLFWKKTSEENLRQDHVLLSAESSVLYRLFYS